MCICDVYKDMINIKSPDEIENILHENLPNGTEIINNNDGTYLINTVENISKEMFSEYKYFENAIRLLYRDASVPLELLYNILSLGNNSYLLQFKKLSR